MTQLRDIVKAFEASWRADTAYNESDWTEENKARGQCVVSSLVVQDYLGGDLLRYSIEAENLSETHYINQLDDGTLIGTTGKQYVVPVSSRLKRMDLRGFSSAREKMLFDEDTRIRYELLKARVGSFLSDSANLSIF